MSKNATVANMIVRLQAGESIFTEWSNHFTADLNAKARWLAKGASIDDCAQEGQLCVYEKALEAAASRNTKLWQPYPHDCVMTWAEFAMRKWLAAEQFKTVDHAEALRKRKYREQPFPTYEPLEDRPAPDQFGAFELLECIETIFNRRDKTIIRYLFEMRSVAEIAERMFLTVRTIEKRRQSICKRLAPYVDLPFEVPAKRKPRATGAKGPRVTPSTNPRAAAKGSRAPNAKGSRAAAVTRSNGRGVAREVKNDR